MRQILPDAAAEFHSPDPTAVLPQKCPQLEAVFSQVLDSHELMAAPQLAVGPAALRAADCRHDPAVFST
jgi:hypothetical protein